jgi:hypothetical protein
MQAGRPLSKNSLWLIPQTTQALVSKSKRWPRAVRQNSAVTPFPGERPVGGLSSSLKALLADPDGRLAPQDPRYFPRPREAPGIAVSDVDRCPRMAQSTKLQILTCRKRACYFGETPLGSF